MGIGSLLFLSLVVLFVIVFRNQRRLERIVDELETKILLLKNQLEMHIDGSLEPQKENTTETEETIEEIEQQLAPVDDESIESIDPLSVPSFDMVADIPIIPEPATPTEPIPVQSFATPADEPMESDQTEWDTDPAFDVPYSLSDSMSEIEENEESERSPETALKGAEPGRLEQRWAEFRANVDWELFTGVKLFAWLGGLALFIGAGFFVKYSIDRDLIPPAMRLAIGAITGISLIIGSNRFDRMRYDVLRHTLGAGGIGVLYTVVFAATLYYHYLSNTVGFSLLTVVSAAAFVLAVYYQGIAISVLGALGAYLTPILVTTGQGNLAMLFLYLSVINIGLYQVVTRLHSITLLFIATVGTLTTLSLGTFAGHLETDSLIIAAVWIFNLALFSTFVGLTQKEPEEDQLLSWTGNLLYLSMPLVSLGIMNRAGSAPLIIVTAGMAGAIALAFMRKGWFSRVIPYGVALFCLAFYWTLTHFDPGQMSLSFAIILVYGAISGLGPVILIRKYGLDRINLTWFRIFPVAMGLMVLGVVIKSPQISFWFWPLVLVLELLGILISLLFGALIQVGLLVVFFILSGITLVLRMPPNFAGPEFYGFLLFAGAISSVAIMYIIIKLPGWLNSLNLGDSNAFIVSGQSNKTMTEWIQVFPSMGAFILLAVIFSIQRPLQPHPGMATLVCFLALSLFLSRRLSSQALAVVALLSAASAQGVWILRPGLDQELFFSALLWSSALFCTALIMPFMIFKSLERWSRVWMGWALFELLQGLFLIWAADNIWPRQMSGWSPLALAFLKLPFIYRLQVQLNGRPERNAILAFHGGTLLFYVSAIPVLLLDQGWLGLTLVFEASLLLWLNRRVEHEGLRWVATAMAPLGLMLLFFSLPQMKGPDSLIILNGAILSVAAATAALAGAVKVSAFPNRSLKQLDLPLYFLWLAIGTGFFLLNLVVADLFGKQPQVFNVIPAADGRQAICYGLVWLVFGAAQWSVKRAGLAIRSVGLTLVCLGAGSIILMPFLFPEYVPGLQSGLNFGLPAYAAALIILVLLFVRELRENFSRHIYNLILSLLLIMGFMLAKVELTTLFEPGMPFRLFFGHAAPMAAGSAIGWMVYGLGLLLWPRGLDRSFRIAGTTLILLGLIKVCLFPFSHSAAFGSMTPLLNYPSLLFLFVLLMLISLTVNRPRQFWPFESPGPVGFWGTLLALMIFFVLNIEISSLFVGGRREFSLLTYGSLAHYLAYSLGWMVYGLGLLLWPRGLDRSFRIAGTTLILLGLIKVCLFPFSHSAAFGSMTPLLNYPSLLFLFVLLMLISLTVNRPRQFWPFESPGPVGFWGTLLALMIFFVLNIEISSLFVGGGREFSLLTYGSLAHQLAYSLGWMVYSIGLLVVGIRWNSIKVRWAALAILVITSLKIFFMDLWRLGQLYRVASFVGLAAVLIMVSFLYQRFLSKGGNLATGEDN